MNKVERNIKLTVAYDGTNYHGFQRQKNAVTIQHILEEKLAKFFGHPLKLIGAGRTDAGVHAHGQVVNFLTHGTIPCERIPLAAKSALPADIVVLSAEEVPLDFHARKSAQSKIYVYRIYQNRLPNPFYRNYTWHITEPLDVKAITNAAQAIIGTHDFSAFRAAGGAAISPVRTILEARCRMEGQVLELTFWGTGFLYHMVRNLVGTLLDVGMGRLDKAGFIRILVGRDRNKAGITAPPQGLYLQQVMYN
jgi:pseudouridylate synthase I